MGQQMPFSVTEHQYLIKTMKKFRKYALMLCASAATLTLAYCGGGGGGGGGGEATPPAGDTGGNQNDSGYAPTSLVDIDYLMASINSQYAWLTFHSGGTVSLDADYTYSGISTLDGEGTYSYTKTGANQGRIDFSTTTSKGVTVVGQFDISFDAPRPDYLWGSAEYRETVSDGHGNSRTNTYNVNVMLGEY